MTQITTTELPQTFQMLLIEVERTKTPLTVIHDDQKDLGDVGADLYKNRCLEL